MYWKFTFYYIEQVIISHFADFEQVMISHLISNLFNWIAKENYYKPIEIKSAFDDSYIEYKSRGDNNDNLSLEEYLNIIRPYLKDMTDNHKAHSEWKIQ